MVLILFFTMIKASLSSIIKFILKRSGKPCPFCRNEHSMITKKTSDYHKQVCKKCGFSIIVDDRIARNVDSNNNESSTTDAEENSVNSDSDNENSPTNAKTTSVDSVNDSNIEENPQKSSNR